MRDVRSRRFSSPWIGAALLATGLVVAGSFAVASGSADDESKDDEVHKKKDVRVYVSHDGDAPDVWVSSDDDDEEGPPGAYLGVSIEEDTKSPDGGARVDSVAEDSPAGKAGIHRGDTIVSFGGTAIHGPARLTEKIHAAKPGEHVEVKVRRKDGKNETLSVEMGERPKVRGYWFGNGEGTPHLAPLPDIEGLDEHGDLGRKLRFLRAPHAHSWIWGGDRPRLGVELVETTPDLREYLGGPRESGVLVGKVIANTPAQRSGLKVGDLIVAVDGKRIEDSGELIEAMDDKEGKTIDIELVREHKTTRVQVAIPKQDETDDAPTGPRAMRAPVPPTAPRDRQRLQAAQDLVRAQLAAVIESRQDTQRALAATDEADRVVRDALRRARQAVREALRRAEADKLRGEADASRALSSL